MIVLVGRVGLVGPRTEILLNLTMDLSVLLHMTIHLVTIPMDSTYNNVQTTLFSNEV
jgi:hypothetical protein